MTDQELMPFGKYKGTPMGEVPAFYLLWLWDNDRCSKTVHDYIRDNMDALEEEAKKSKQSKNYSNGLS